MFWRKVTKKVLLFQDWWNNHIFRGNKAYKCFICEYQIHVFWHLWCHGLETNHGFQQIQQRIDSTNER